MGKTSFLCQPRGRPTAARGIDFQKPAKLERGWKRSQLAICRVTSGQLRKGLLLPLLFFLRLVQTPLDVLGDYLWALEKTDVVVG